MICVHWHITQHHPCFQGVYRLKEDMKYSNNYNSRPHTEGTTWQREWRKISFGPCRDPHCPRIKCQFLWWVLHAMCVLGPAHLSSLILCYSLQQVLLPAWSTASDWGSSNMTPGLCTCYSNCLPPTALPWLTPPQPASSGGGSYSLFCNAMAQQASGLTSPEGGAPTGLGIYILGVIFYPV